MALCTVRGMGHVMAPCWHGAGHTVGPVKGMEMTGSVEELTTGMMSSCSRALSTCSRMLIPPSPSPPGFLGVPMASQVAL